MKKYSRELFDNIDSYYNEVLDYLKSTNNYYEREEINFDVGDKHINYYRWQHPYQGDWELTELFTLIKLEYVRKLIKPNSVVLDIGAHTGNMSVAYSMFADKVISFEPNGLTVKATKLDTPPPIRFIVCVNVETSLVNVKIKAGPAETSPASSLVTSISCKPESDNKSIYVILSSEEMIWDWLCNPSLGPTSIIFTKFYLFLG